MSQINPESTISESTSNCEADTPSSLDLEREFQNQTFKKGPYLFLLSRTQNEYERVKTLKRRELLAEQCDSSFPVLSDDILQFLYTTGRDNYESYCRDNYKGNGFDKTYSELQFFENLEKIKQDLPILKDVEIIPTSSSESKRMSTGPYVPDFIFFGLSRNGCSLVTVEVDGEYHFDYKKSLKDKNRDDDLRSMKIDTIRIENKYINDLDILKKIFNDVSMINITDRKDQLDIIKRKIWVKTIVNFLSLKEIECLILEKFQVEPNLINEFHALVKLPNCPRDIKSEYKVWKNNL